MSNKESGVCPQCKVIIPNEASFCGQCGSKTSTSDVNAQNPSRLVELENAVENAGAQLLNVKFLLFLLFDLNGRIGSRHCWFNF